MLDEIMEAIARATYKGSDAKYETPVVYKSQLPILREAVERAIRKHVEKDVERETELAKVSAKVYVYETIIKNSNFMPMLYQQRDDVLALEEGEQE